MLRLDNASSLIGATRTFRMLKSPSVDQTMAHDVFISYSSKDKLTADAVCAAMESRGIRCWIAPRDVLPGVPYAAALVNALRDSRIMVLVLSSDANQSQQVLRELERAASRGLAIIPLRIEDVVPSAEMEYYISSRHWLDALTPPLEHHLVRLCDTVKILLAATPASPASDSHEQAVKHVPAEQKDVRMASADSPNLESAEGREAPAASMPGPAKSAEPRVPSAASSLSPAWLRRNKIFGLFVLAVAIIVAAIFYFHHKPSPGAESAQATTSQPSGSAPGSNPAQTPAAASKPAPGLPTNVKTKVNADDGLTYVWIPPGTFQMGCSPNDSECGNAEKPVHSVTISAGFWLGQTPVTEAAYKQITGSNPSYFRGDQVPVHDVSWNDAVTYCGRAGMRLPTEAEWEYAARGGKTEASYGPLDQIAWYGDNSGDAPHSVGQKQPNSFGLYDILGDVQEWAADWYGTFDGPAAVDPKGPATGRFRVVRGGSWGDDATIVRVSVRRKIVPGGLGNLVGFRCAGN